MNRVTRQRMAGVKKPMKPHPFVLDHLRFMNLGAVLASTITTIADVIAAAIGRTVPVVPFIETCVDLWIGWAAYQKICIVVKPGDSEESKGI